MLKLRGWRGAEEWLELFEEVEGLGGVWEELVALGLGEAGGWKLEAGKGGMGRGGGRGMVGREA